MEQLTHEIVTEHLSYSPITFIDDIINAVNALVYRSISALETYLKKLPRKYIPEEEIENGLQQFETLLESIIDRNFDAFELYCLRYICPPTSISSLFSNYLNFPQTWRFQLWISP